jgi:hypothetical protein
MTEQKPVFFTGDVLPISPYTGEPYDPQWGYRQRRP